jgi:repressor LexA
MALTKRQKQVLDFIANFVDQNGYCPSFEEIARGLELASLATVHKHISVLEAKNYLKRGFNQSRSLELAPRYLQEQRKSKPMPGDVPLMGRIAAGAPGSEFGSVNFNGAKGQDERVQFSARVKF